MSTVLSKERASIAKSLGACLTPVNAPDEPANPLDFNNSDLTTLNFENLVRLRFAHQTRQAATGIRKKAASTAKTTMPENGSEGEKTKKKVTERQLLIKQFHEVIKRQQDRGTGTGAERSLRWQGNVPTTGNAANAAEAAATRQKAARLITSNVWSAVIDAFIETDTQKTI
jgi:hypothetical protein